MKENIDANAPFFEYEFRDFYLTAFLLCECAQLEKVRVVDKKKSKCVFVIKSQKEVESVIRDFFNDKALINPQKYKEKIISLKSCLHEAKQKVEEENANAEEKEK